MSNPTKEENVMVAIMIIAYTMNLWLTEASDSHYLDLSVADDQPVILLVSLQNKRQLKNSIQSHTLS